MQVDHVVLAARDAADARAAVDRAGLGVARGRPLPGLGLSNLIVPLGTSLLEFHYPDGRDPDPDAPPLLAIDRAVLDAHPDQPVMPVAWIVDYADPAELRRLAAQHAMPILDAPSEGPGFPRYLLAGFGATFDRPWLPALIHWPVPRSRRPAALAAPHTRQPVGISGLDVSGPVDEIADWCGGLPDGLRCTPGRHGIQAVTVAFADGAAHRFGPP